MTKSLVTKQPWQRLLMTTYWQRCIHCMIKNFSTDSTITQKSLMLKTSGRRIIATMTSEVTRVTMIKLPSEGHVPIALKGFKAFTKNQKKVLALWYPWLRNCYLTKPSFSILGRQTIHPIHASWSGGGASSSPCWLFLTLFSSRLPMVWDVGLD